MSIALTRKRLSARCATSQALHRFSIDRAGASAVEFSIVIVPFLFLVCAILEAGLQLFSQSILQQAVDDASRQIYTGRFQTTNSGTTDSATLLKNFKTAICYPDGHARATTFSCDNLRLSVRKAASFGNAVPADATKTDATTGASDWNPDFTSYSCARANDVMVVQAAVDVPVFFPMIGAANATLPNNRRVLQAASVFKVEPYDSSSACQAN